MNYVFITPGKEREEERELLTCISAVLWPLQSQVFELIGQLFT